jgi:hypothetical protein
MAAQKTCGKVSFQELYKVFCVLLLITFLHGCGGGSGDDSSPEPAPIPNQPPIASAGSSQSVDEDTEVVVSGTGTDSDGSISTYSWTQTSGIAITLSSSNTPSTKFIAPFVTADETITLQLTVTDNEGATAVSGTSIQIINAPPITISGFVYNDIVSGAIVTLEDKTGNIIGQATSDAEGGYSLTFENDQSIDNCYRLSTADGTIANVEFGETLTATYCGDSILSEQINITPITTLIDIIANRLDEADIFVANNLAIQQLRDIGLLTEGNAWNNLNTDVISYAMLSLEVQSLGGLSIWLDSIIDDINDKQLSAVRVRNIFKRAHGGIEEIISTRAELFPSQFKKIRIDVSMTDESLPNPISYSLINAPDWISLDDGILDVRPSEDTLSGIYEYQISASVESDVINRINTFEVEIFTPTILLEGMLDVNGGNITNEEQDIILTSPIGVLSDSYRLVYRASISQGGGLITNLTSIPSIPDSELSQLALTIPSIEDLIQKLTPQEVQKQTNHNISQQASLSENQGSTSYSESTTCSESAGDLWQDRNDDGFSFNHRWDCWDGMFLEPRLLVYTNFGTKGDGIVGGLPYTFKSIPPHFGDNIRFQRAFVLRSNISKSLVNREDSNIPVLFVHGFKPDGYLGGFDYDNSFSSVASGEFSDDISGEYFGAFPRLVDKYSSEGGDKFIPFLFQWRTNVPFQTGAHYLGEAIRSISQSTGKKVHIVAHSFGGILSRTLIQGLAQDDIFSEETTFNNTFIKNNIASFTTIGTPHSGIFRNSDDASDRTIVHKNDEPLQFPGGTDDLAGSLIGACEAITCHQMGAKTDDLLDLRGDATSENAKDNRFGMYQNKGFIVYKLNRNLETDGWPDIITQVLIGLTGDTNVLFDDSIGGIKGDSLISIAGQRFDAADDSESNGFKSLLSIGSPKRFSGSNNIDEHFLGFQEFEFNDTFTFTDSDDVALFRSFTDYYLADLKGGFLNFSTRVSLFKPESEKLSVYRVVDGHNHRTGKYNKKLVGNDMSSEVGLQECTKSSPNECRHNTWRYFTSFLSTLDLGEIAPPEDDLIFDSDLQLINFMEGDPGTVGDSQSIGGESYNIGFLRSATRFNPFPLPFLVEGTERVTLTLYSDAPVLGYEGYIFFGFRGDECDAILRTIDTRITELNYSEPTGVIGIFGTVDILDLLADFGAQGCVGDASDIYVLQVQASAFFGGGIRLDAFAIGNGPLNVLEYVPSP